MIYVCYIIAIPSITEQPVTVEGAKSHWLKNRKVYNLHKKSRSPPSSVGQREAIDPLHLVLARASITDLLAGLASSAALVLRLADARERSGALLACTILERTTPVS